MSPAEVRASGSTSSNSERSSFVGDPVLPPTSIDVSGRGPTPGASSPIRSGVFMRSSTFSTSTPLGPTGLAMVVGSVGSAGLPCQFKRANDTSSISASTSMSSPSFSSTVGSVGTSFLSVPVGFFSSSAFFLAAAAALRDASGDARRGKLLSSSQHRLGQRPPPSGGLWRVSRLRNRRTSPGSADVWRPSGRCTLGGRRAGIRRLGWRAALCGHGWDRGLGDTSNVDGPLRLGGRSLRWRDGAFRWRHHLRRRTFGLGLAGRSLRHRGSRRLCGGRHRRCRISHLHVMRLARAICPGGHRWRGGGVS